MSSHGASDPPVMEAGLLSPLRPDELVRYGRHLSLPGVGTVGQERLKAAKVAIVGLGGLGSPAAMYLAAAGVGTVGLIDGDRVDVSNLQRQVLYGDADVGRPKVDVAARRISQQNPNVALELYPERLDSTNAIEVLERFDIVLDGSDNFPTRYLVNDATVLLGIPSVHGSVLRFEGRVSVFGSGTAPCYRCLYPAPPPPGVVQDCQDAGVLGVLPGLVGVLQATEVIKLICGLGDTLAGRLLIVDGLGLVSRHSASTATQNVRCAAHAKSRSWWTTKRSAASQVGPAAPKRFRRRRRPRGSRGHRSSTFVNPGNGPSAGCPAPGWCRCPSSRARCRRSIPPVKCCCIAITERGARPP